MGALRSRRERRSSTGTVSWRRTVGRLLGMGTCITVETGFRLFRTSCFHRQRRSWPSQPDPILGFSAL